MRTVNENLKKFRRFRNMTQQDLATALNVTVTSVANWERGASNMGLDIFLQICMILKATPNQMCGIDECPELNEFLKEQERIQAEKDKAKRIMAYAKEMEGKLYNQHSNDESDIRKSDS